METDEIEVQNMKLRKALEKAKKARGEPVLSSEVFTLKAADKPAADEWQPPVYCKSIKVELDTGTVLNNRCVCLQGDAPELDCYKVLHTKIQQLTQAKGWRTLMITSPGAGEGKTLTAINLALTFSKAYNQTVLLVDCDLRNQNVHKTLGLESESGLIDYLADNKALQEFIIWPGIDKLTLISGGRAIRNSSELLGSPKMKELVDELKSRYEDRYVIFDTAPILMGADALALAPSVDGIVMVVEEGRTAMRHVQKALEMIPPEKFLGFVMNRQRVDGSQYGYYYHYR
jgi:protein-tyrosine kinase